MKFVSLPRFAVLCKVHENVIYDAVERGLIRVRHGKGGKIEINPETQRPAFFRMKAELGEGVKSIPKKPKKQKPTKAQELKSEDLEGEDYLLNEPPNVNSDDMTGLRASKARKEKALAKKAELETAEREGRLVSLEDVILRWKEIGIILQKAVMAIPDRVAPIVAGERNPEKVNTLLVAEFKRTLRDLSIDIKKEFVKKNGNGR